jgi:protein involved in polysaccharide export with SLBB domain/capsular polysaccharide biosynthesis protein
MNENFEDNAEGSTPRDEDRYTSHSRGNRANTNGNGYARYPANGHPRRKIFNFWTVAEILARRWHWPVVAGILAAGAFFTLGWYRVQPRFTATAELLRYETPGTSEFLKTAPLTPQTFAELITAPDLLGRAGAKMQPPISANELAKRLIVDPLVDSDFFKVSLSASTEAEAIQRVNTYAQEATNYTSELQARQAAQVAETYLKQQVQEMDKDIGDLTAQFRGMPGASQASNKVAELGHSVNSLTQNPALSPQSTFLISKLNEQLQSAKLALDQLSVKFTDEHPQVIAARRTVDTLSNQLAQATGSANGTQAAAVIEANGNVVQPEVEVIRARLRSLEEARVQLASRQHEAQLYASDPPGIVRISAPADLRTTRSHHRRLKIGALTIFGGGVGMVFGLLLVFLTEITDHKLRTAEDIVRVTRLPILTTLGELDSMKEHARTQWAFRTWTMLQGRLSHSQNHGLVCGVTSSTDGEGRSTCIRMLAEAASLAGFRVLTIATRPSSWQMDSPNDLDEDALNKHAHMNGDENPDAGNSATGYPNYSDESNNAVMTSSVLATPSEVTDKLADPNCRPVVHIPLPGWVWNLERRKQWRDALQHWRKMENLVIFVELPPASVPEAVLLAANLPNLVWLTASGKADANETRDQLETLRNAHCNLVGAVLNREASRPIKSYFPRWLTPLVVFGLLSVLGLSAQTPESATPATAPQSNNADTNMPLLVNEPPAADINQPTDDTNYSFSVVSPSQRADWERHLTLGPGDVLSLSLYGEPTLARIETAIGPDGRVSFLEAQDVVATGLTVDGLREKIDQALGRYRRSPRTIVVPVAYHSKKYYVLGKVVQRGVYTLDRPTTVLEALARAKGIESGQVDYDIVDVADLKHSFLMRDNKRIPVDFERLFANGDLSQNVQIEPNDYLYFPSSDVQQVYVLGEVTLPGPVTYRPNMTVLGAISARGGFNLKAFKSHVLVVRGSLNHPQTFVVDTMGITSGRLTDFRLERNDIIYVTWRPFYRGEELIDAAATSFVTAIANGWVSSSIVAP